MKWKRRSQDRLARLALAIDAIAEHDRRLVEEGALVDDLHREGAAALYRICRSFVDDLNGRLVEPAVILDPSEWNPDGYDAGSSNLFQISLRGRLLQIEFTATEEPYSTEDFRQRYVLSGGVRSFNQNFLEKDTVDEQQIFFCPGAVGAAWHFFDARTYRSGLLTVDYLAAELERLL